MKNTTAQNSLNEINEARDLIEAHRYAKRVKGGLVQWMNKARPFICKVKGTTFHGAMNCDGIILFELNLIADAK
jgi:hypothetical protein